MRVEKNEYEYALRREFVRGYLTAVEEMSRNVGTIKNELESTAITKDFEEWCLSQKSCKACPYGTDPEIDCAEAYTKAIREGTDVETK